MFNHDSRNGYNTPQFTASPFTTPNYTWSSYPTSYATAPYSTTPYTTTPYTNTGVPNIAYTSTPWTGSTGYATSTTTQEVTQLACRLEEIRAQVAALTELVRFETVRKTAGHIHDFHHEFNPIRLRESDSHIFLDICLPHLTMGDVELEVSGNRVICRTRVPVAPMNRSWINQQVPRGFEIFELADGRVEFSWIAPVLFQAKEVEATWREGFLAICIPKAEVAQRHTVKIVKETVGSRKASGDMNA